MGGDGVNSGISDIRERLEKCPVPEGATADLDVDVFSVVGFDPKCREDRDWVRFVEPEHIGEPEVDGEGTVNAAMTAIGEWVAGRNARILEALVVACNYRPDVSRLLNRIADLEQTVAYMAREVEP